MRSNRIEKKIAYVFEWEKTIDSNGDKMSEMREETHFTDEEDIENVVLEILNGYNRPTESLFDRPDNVQNIIRVTEENYEEYKHRLYLNSTRDMYIL